MNTEKTQPAPNKPTPTQFHEITVTATRSDTIELVQLTVAMSQFWLIIEAVDYLRSQAVRHPEGSGTIPAQLSELRDQMAHAWEAMIRK